MAMTSRPVGRDAEPGDLCGPQKPGEYPHGHGPQCRRCSQDCTMAGHPNGCPITPTDWDYLGMPIRPCYCTQTMITAPERFGPCCRDTPPVIVPGGCLYCGRTTVRINDPDDQPDRSYWHYDVPRNYPELTGYWGDLDFWIHTSCVDEHLLAKGRTDIVESRRQKRAVPLGVVDAT